MKDAFPRKWQTRPKGPARSLASRASIRLIDRRNSRHGVENRRVIGGRAVTQVVRREVQAWIKPVAGWPISRKTKTTGHISARPDDRPGASGGVNHGVDELATRGVRQPEQDRQHREISQAIPFHQCRIPHDPGSGPSAILPCLKAVRGSLLNAKGGRSVAQSLSRLPKFCGSKSEERGSATPNHRPAWSLDRCPQTVEWIIGLTPLRFVGERVARPEWACCDPDRVILPEESTA